VNLIDYNQAVEALERERQYLLNREQYGAENVLVHHALNVIAELPIIRQPELVRCKDCKNRSDSLRCPLELLKKQLEYTKVFTYDIPDDWFCADGERKDNG
jgi:hypothetical protein